MARLDDIEVITINSPKEMIAEISDKLVKPYPQYGFRGHTETEWKLSPTLMRFTNSTLDNLGKKGVERERLKNKLHQSLLNEFKKNLINNNDIPQNKIESMDLWQYGQHFGLPTPLLDWSESPYVALFFALSELSLQTSHTTRCIWVLNIDNLKALNREIVRISLKEKIDKTMYEPLEIVFEQNQSNRRITFQQGFFTKHTFFNSFEIWLQQVVKILPRNSLGSPILKKYIFKCTDTERLESLKILDKMNINFRTLFPDIEGSVKGAKQTAIDSLGDPLITSVCWTNYK
jgi:hypothetical protein